MDFFAEYRAFQQTGGASCLSASAGMLYYAILGIVNETRTTEFTRPKNLLKTRSGLSDKATFWRARRELEDKGIATFADASRYVVRVVFIGIAPALTDDGGAGEMKPPIQPPCNHPYNHGETTPPTTTPAEGPADGHPSDPIPNHTEPNPVPPLAPQGGSASDGVGTGNGKPLTKKGKRRTKAEMQATPPEYSSDFETWWKAYPRKINKTSAWESWEKIAEGGTLPSLSVILTSVATQKKTRQWSRNNGDYIPYPTTWLNNRRWEDTNDAAKGNGIGGGSRQPAERTRDELRRDGWRPDEIDALLRGVRPGEHGFPAPSGGGAHPVPVPQRAAE